MGLNGKTRGRSFEIDPNKLTPYERNSRIHNPAQIAMIEKSIRQFGFIKPVICDENKMVLAGHGARLAAINLGMKQIPCRMITGLTDQEKRSYVIADNRSSELSKWDWELLTVELSELHDANVDLQPIGFEDFGTDPASHHRASHNVTLGEGRFLLQLEFATEQEMQVVYEELDKRGIDIKVLE